MGTALHSITSEIRDFLNHPRILHDLTDNIAKWFQICASLDVVEDTEQAVSAYQSMQEPKAVAGRYLALFGLLQALFVQQDAVISLSEALDMKLSLKDRRNLLKIRDVRNDIVGHPTNRNKGASFHAVSQMTLRQASLEVVASFSDGTTRFEVVQIFPLLDLQQLSLREMLSDVWPN